MTIADIQVLPVILSAIIYFVIGMLWYSPKAFGKRWMELTQTKCENCNKMCTAMAGAFIVGLVLSAVMAHFVNVSGATTALAGAQVGFLAWLGFVATLSFSCVLWEKKPLELYLIHVGCVLVSFLAISALLGAWH